LFKLNIIENKIKTLDSPALWSWCPARRKKNVPSSGPPERSAVPKVVRFEWSPELGGGYWKLPSYTQRRNPTATASSTDQKVKKWHPVNYKWCYMLPIEDGDSIVMSLMSVSLPEGMPQWGQERQKFDRRPGPFLGCPIFFFLNRSATKDWDPVVKLICPLVNQHSYRTSPLLMGRSTISMAIFNSKLLNYQRVIPFWSMNDFNYL